MDVQIEQSWKSLLAPEFEKPYFKKLVQFVKQEYASHTIFPPGKQIFNAFEHCLLNDLKVVILGQDPYHGPGQANGLSFSVNEGITFPPSLRNIFKEITSEFGNEFPLSGDLSRWASQGVLLLNATLTVRARSAGSHQKKGWEEFTDAVIETINRERENVVFMLWGAYAQKKGQIIETQRHLVLSSPHPSPFSANRGFFGNNHFIQANEYLNSLGIGPIDWT